mgnify:CR=1 FL=1
MAQIHEKLAAIQSAIAQMPKDKRHAKGFMFRGIDDFLNTMHPLFEKEKVVVIPSVSSVTEGIYRTKNGVEMPSATVLMNYKIISEDGSFENAGGSGHSYSMEGAQVANASKDAYKTMLEQLFSIPTVKQQEVAGNNGYEKIQDDKQKVSSINESQLARLEGLIKRTEDWEAFFQMATWFDSTDKLSKDPAASKLAIEAAKILVNKLGMTAFKKALMKAPDWKWYGRMIMGANQQSSDNINATMLDKSKNHLSATLGEMPPLIYKALKEKLK